MPRVEHHWVPRESLRRLPASVRALCCILLFAASALNGAAARDASSEAAAETKLPASVRELRRAAESRERPWGSRSPPTPLGSGSLGYWTRETVELPYSDERTPPQRMEIWKYVEVEDEDLTARRFTRHDDRLSVPPLPTPRAPLGLPYLHASSSPQPIRPRAASEGLFDHFAGELFAVQLHLRLARAALPRKLRLELEAYLTERDALVNELLAQLAVPQAANDTAVWRALAARQSPRLEALERDAEELRQKLQRSAFLDGPLFDPWRNRRRLDRAAQARPRSKLVVWEATLARAAAFGAEGFSPGQRRLLLEASGEMLRPGLKFRAGGRDTVGPAAARLPLAGRRLVVGFLPEQVVLDLGAPLANEVVDELLAIDALKRTLKQELLDAVYFNDRFSGATQRAVFSRLAKAQEARLDELERRADALRPALALRFEAHERAAPGVEQRTYRAAVITPGLLPAQRRLLVAVAALEHRRSSISQPEVATVGH